MLFNSAAYLVFLPVVVAIYWFMPFRYRTAFLLFASYVFYMTWKPIYLVLIVALTAFNYFAGIAIEKQKKQRKLVLIASLAANILTLAYFKYAYFAIDATNSVLAIAGRKISYPLHEIILPLGISFFVFEFIHYLVDVYKGSPAVKAPLEFALFPSFFPTQIAGPIKRFQDFVPQLHKPAKITLKDFDEGVELILWGLFKKVIVADSVAVVIDKCMPHPEMLSTFDCWSLLWAFAIQVYFDFSGYTDIARGSAALLGFKVPLNFNLPFLAGSITEYWRRWHISLSLWLRDYLFFPLGGSKHGTMATLRNVMITFTLAGLWHGAGLNYIIFGAMHGLWLNLNRLWRIQVEKSTTLLKLTETKVFHCFGVLLTFNCLAVTLVTFRLPSMELSGRYFQKLLMLSPQTANSVNPWAMTIPSIEGPANFALFPVILISIVIGHLISNKIQGKSQPGVLPLPQSLQALRPAYLAAIAILLLLFAPDGTPSFVYFQF